MFKKLLQKIANMSRKASAVYALSLTLLFFVGICFFLAGILYLLPDVVPPAFAMPCLAVGTVLIVLVLATVAVTSVASNYIEGNEKEEGEEKK